MITSLVWWRKRRDDGDEWGVLRCGGRFRLDEESGRRGTVINLLYYTIYCIMDTKCTRRFSDNRDVV
jgi:hypothetical protein